jgi:N-acetylmuramoyl-L-alanine amidase
LIRIENLVASERLAVAIQSRLDLAMDIENRGVKQAPFYVLVGAQMPAVLVEVGFMSNPVEAAMLFRPEVQDKIVNALYKSIIYYDQVRAASD